MLTEETADHPIKWVKDEKSHAHWKDYGEMTEERCFELFGTDYSDELEIGEKGILVGGILFTDNFKVAKEELDFPGEAIEEIKPFSESKTINIILFKQFHDDLTDYYERMNSNNWENVPNWRQTATFFY